jgi:hypothetical protein
MERFLQKTAITEKNQKKSINKKKEEINEIENIQRLAKL